MIEANKIVFAKITDFIRNAQLEIHDDIRFFSTNQIEKEWLKTAITTDYNQHNPRQHSILLFFNNNYYIVLVGFDIQFENDDIFEAIEVNAGIFTLVISEVKMNIKSNSDINELLDITYPGKKEHEYKGHEFYPFLKFFDSIRVFKLADNAIINNSDPNRLTAYLLIKSNTKYNILPFSTKTIESYERIVLEGVETISFENIMSSILASTFKHSFLEVYRNIEMLFPISKLCSLHDRSNSQLKFNDFWQQFDSILKWKPNEESALTEIINELQIDAHEEIRKFIGSESNIAKYIYSLRNSIVHYRLDNRDINKSDDEWNAIIKFCIDLTTEYYKKYSFKMLEN